MKQIDLLKAKDAAVAAVLPLRQKFMESYGNVQNTIKDDKSVVTQLDTWAEIQIKESLKLFDPSIGYLGEEFGAEGDTDCRWVMDPIDGTESFIRGIPTCGTMVCLVRGKEILVSVLYMFVVDDLFWAIKGHGAWRGTKQIHVSQRALERSFIDTALDSASQDEVNVYKKLKSQVNAVVRLYGSCYVNTLIARGAIEGRLRIKAGGGGPWDYAPGALLITEAGGLVEHFGGKIYDYTDASSYVAGTPAFVAMAKELSA